MYQLNLSKRVNTLGNSPNGMCVLGYFDSLSVSKISSIEEFVDISDTSCDPNHFLKYSMAAFDIGQAVKSNHSYDLMTVLSNANKLQGIFLFCSLRISAFFLHYMTEQMQDNHPVEGYQMYNLLKQCISDELESHLKPIGSAVEYQVLGTLGSFDCIVVCRAASNAKILSRIPHWLRRIRHDGIGVFEYSTSFCCFDKNMDFSKISSKEECRIIVRCSAVHCLTGRKKIEELFIDREVNVNVSRSLGDDDFSIDITGSLQSVLLLFSKSNEFSVFNDEFYRIHRATHTSFGLDNDDSDVDLEKPCPLSVGVTEKRIDEIMRNRSQALMTELLEIEAKVSDLLPSLVKHSVNTITKTCCYLLQSDFRTFSGQKVARILISALQKFRDSKNPTLGAICACVRDISFILPSAVLSDSIYLDNIDEIDMTSPVSKLLLSVEDLLMSAYQQIRRGQMDRPLRLFVTMGMSEYINSRFYFRGSQLPGGKEALISCNLPNLSWLAVKRSYPFLLHEISHYCSVTGSRETRNKAYLKMIIQYIVVSISATLREENIQWDGPRLTGILTQLITEGLLQPYNDHLDAFRFNIHVQLRKAIEKIPDALSKANEDTDPIPLAFASHIVAQILRECYINDSFMRGIATALREAHADALMIRLGGYSLYQYLCILHDHFKGNQLRPQWDDLNFLQRMASVICLMLGDESFSDSYEVWWPKVACELDSEICNFFAPVFLFAHENRLMLKPIIEYLHVTDQVKPLDLYGITGTQLMEPNALSEDDEIRFYLNHWFSCIKHRKGDNVER